MKVVCHKDNLIQGINIVQKAVSTKSTQPILEGILIEAADNLKLTGNDLEIGIESFIEADILTKGSIVINSKMLGEIVRKLPDSMVMMEVRENKSVYIECENSHFEIRGLPADGYPALPEINRQEVLKIKQNVLRDMIRQTVFAVGSDPNRPILSGSMIENNENNFTIVSIDGFRLALRQKEFETENGAVVFNAVVPGKTLNEVVKILQPEDNNIEICKSKNQILFDLGNCRIVSRLLEGEYMNYRSIIPKEYETKIKVKTKELLSSIERATLVSIEEKKYPVKFKISDEKLIISSNTELGNVREEINVDLTGERIEIGFNPRFFIDALKAVEDDEVNINFTTPLGPCTVTPLEGEEYSYLIVPVRIKSDI